jgi:hypothetical protein
MAEYNRDFFNPARSIAFWHVRKILTTTVRSIAA